MVINAKHCTCAVGELRWSPTDHSQEAGTVIYYYYKYVREAATR